LSTGKVGGNKSELKVLESSRINRQQLPSALSAYTYAPSGTFMVSPRSTSAPSRVCQLSPMSLQNCARKIASVYCVWVRLLVKRALSNTGESSASRTLSCGLEISCAPDVESTATLPFASRSSTVTGMMGALILVVPRPGVLPTMAYENVVGGSGLKFASSAGEALKLPVKFTSESIPGKPLPFFALCSAVCRAALCRAPGLVLLGFPAALAWIGCLPFRKVASTL